MSETVETPFCDSQIHKELNRAVLALTDIADYSMESKQEKSYRIGMGILAKILFLIEEGQNEKELARRFRKSGIIQPRDASMGVLAEIFQKSKSTMHDWCNRTNEHARATLNKKTLLLYKKGAG